MNKKEENLLNYASDKVVYCLHQGIDNNQIAEWLDDFIIGLSEDYSSELFSELYRIQDNLLLGGIEYED